MKHLSALVAGIVFGAGLVVAGMTNPDLVLAFLTLNAQWDSTLLYVLGTAVIVASIGYRLIGARKAPLFDADFHAPTSTIIDARLLSGAGVFGLGWGIAGFCPGPALVGLMTLDPRAGVFLVGFVAGLMIFERWFSQSPVAVIKVAATADG
jgi:uncharacterized membrane protein YedE/YeeE